MPWLGDGTWVQDHRMARDIIHGRTNYVPHSGDLRTATPRTRSKRMKGDRALADQYKEVLESEDYPNIQIRANWSQSASQIEWRDRDETDDWSVTGYQVANFEHDKHKALEQILGEWLRETED